MSDTAFAPTDSASPGAASGLPVADTSKVTSQIADAKRSEMAATDKIYSGIDKTISTSIPRIEQLSKTAGVEAQNLKPWNADEESAKRRTDPITAFGSLGSVFGILASAFTHAPMENALNASAAAMHAIKEGDDKSYERAHKGWEDNIKMVLDRHKIEHETYQDAVSLLNTNMEAANMKLKIAAARFGDQKMLAMLEAGMDKDVVDVINSRQTMALRVAEALPKIQAANAEMSELFALGYNPKDSTSEKSQQALDQFRKRQAERKAAEHAYTPEQQAYSAFIKERPDATPEERAEYVKKLRTRDHPLTPEQQAVNTFIEQNPEATAEQIRDFVTELRSRSKANAGAANLTTDRQRAQDVAAYRQKLRAEENEDGSPKYTAEQVAEKAAEFERKLKTTATPLTANRRDDLQGKIDRVSHAEGIFDQIDGLLLKHKAITGIGGMLTRPAEIVGNVLGSNATDREEFKRLVETLRLESPRILLDTQGRPISAEAERVNTIIGGLQPGDTSANTIRNYIELRRQFKEIKADLEKRRGGASGSGGSTAPKVNQGWDAYPVVR